MDADFRKMAEVAWDEWASGPPCRGSDARDAFIIAVEQAIAKAVESETAALRERLAAWREYAEALDDGYVRGASGGEGRYGKSRDRLVALGELDE